MTELTTKVRAVESEIAETKGRLNLFALFEREDVSNRWDLVVSASWAKFDEPTLGYVADVLRRHLTPSEMTLLARIVVLPPDEEPVLAITAAYDVEHGELAFNEAARFRLPVKHGYIITSRKAA